MRARQTLRVNKGDAKARLLDAAVALVRERGFHGTSVDELCQAAGVTKGAFFHHFKGKDELGVAAADHWSEQTGALFASGAYHGETDPLKRLLGYVDLRMAMLEGELSEFTCLIGTMVQEVYETSPAIRAACEASILGHVAQLETDISEAMDCYAVRGEWTAQSLALHTQAVLQGAFILSKATGDVEVARTSLSHLRQYIELLFVKQP